MNAQQPRPTTAPWIIKKNAPQENTVDNSYQYYSHILALFTPSLLLI
jgi:hypothetical protein